jgi:hypothetical protein
MPNLAWRYGIKFTNGSNEQGAIGMKVINKKASELERVEWTHDLFNFSTPKIPCESNCPCMELQNDREANHAMQATPNGAPDG